MVTYNMLLQMLLFATAESSDMSGTLYSTAGPPLASFVLTGTLFVKSELPPSSRPLVEAHCEQFCPYTVQRSLQIICST